MPEDENGSREEQAKWKAPEEAENKKDQEQDEENLVKFDPEKRPGIPRGARFKKGQTVFHEMAALWDEAKATHDYVQSKTILIYSHNK